MTLDVSTAALPLRSGAKIPQVGLGVWQVPAGKTARQTVLAALRAGYRHVDTAHLYANEADVGAAVRESGLPREEVFVTTKLWNDDHGYDRALRAFDASLQRLGLDHVDLYLVHWPVAGKRLDTWRAFEAIKASGRARSIGVSNYLVRHLEELLAKANEPPDQRCRRGSQEVAAPSSRPASVRRASSSSAKSNSAAFSRILASRVDFGRTTTPSSIPQRRRIWAGVRPSRAPIAPSAG